tara:strand:+ start:299 stop:559 length:261 start_codon:yes stop_codon:yes gene_type:complete
MKKSPLYMKSGMGRAAEGSPIQFGLIKQGIKYAGKGAKYIKKNWKELLAGEVGFYAGEKALKNAKNKKETLSSGMDVLNMRHGPKY